MGNFCYDINNNFSKPSKVTNNNLNYLVYYVKMFLRFACLVSLFVQSWPCNYLNLPGEVRNVPNQHIKLDRPDLHEILILIKRDIKSSDLLAFEKNIVDGTFGPIHVFPYQAVLQHEGRFGCGGAVISSKFVLVAAHCLLRAPLENLSVRVGSDYSMNGGQVAPVKKAVTHPKYNKDTNDFNVAILEMVQPLTLSETVKPIMLPNTEKVPLKPNEVGVVSGWGVFRKHTPNMFSKASLDFVVVPLKSWEKCKQKLGEAFTQNMICTDYGQENGSACIEDEGGLFVSKGVLIGIVSGKADCVKHHISGVFTNVTEMRQFINSVTGI